VARSVLVAVVLVCSGAGAAQAAPPDPPGYPTINGNWWYEQQGVPQAQAQGITGKGVPVAVIERGISPNLAVLSDAHLTIHEPSFCRVGYYSDGKYVTTVPATYDGDTEATWGGSNAVAFIAGNGRDAYGGVSVPGVAPGADIRFYATGIPSDTVGECSLADHSAYGSATARAIVQAVDDGARIISLTFTDFAPTHQFSQAMAYALHKKVVLVVPSEGKNYSWIQRLNGVVTVRAGSQDGWGLGSSSPVTVGAPGVGLIVLGEMDWTTDNNWDSSEFPVPLVAGMLADVAQRWPGATNDQLIQTLIRNTAPKLPQDDGGNGYGVVDLPQMLQVDPTQYPDQNPLIVPDDHQKYGLTVADIRTAERPAWADPMRTATPAVAPPGRHRFAGGWAWRAGLGGAVVVLAVVVGFFGFRVRRSWHGAHRGAPDDDPVTNDDPTRQDDLTTTKEK